MNETKQKAYKQAQKQVRRLKKFYQNLAIYLIVNAFLLGLNLYQNPKSLWSLWVVFGWRFSLALQAVKVFLPHLFFSKQWEEQKIKYTTNR